MRMNLVRSETDCLRYGFGFILRAARVGDHGGGAAKRLLTTLHRRLVRPRAARGLIESRRAGVVRTGEASRESACTDTAVPSMKSREPAIPARSRPSMDVDMFRCAAALRSAPPENGPPASCCSMREVKALGTCWIGCAAVGAAGPEMPQQRNLVQRHLFAG